MKIAHIVLAAFVSLSALSMASTAKAEDGDIRRAITDLSGKVERRTLSNGLRVILYKRGVAPVFSGYVGARVGGVDEAPGLTGLSHMLEHMAFKGTEKVGTKDYAKESALLAELEGLMGRRDSSPKLSSEDEMRLAEIYKNLKDIWVMADFTNEYNSRGASGMNAHTTKETTEYYVDLPRSQFEFWCWIESERILHPVMRQFYQERDVVREERRMRFEDPPAGRLYEALLGAAYTVHPYRNPVIGYADDIKRLTASEAKALHNKYYVPENMVVAVVGDVSPATDLGMLEKYFGRIPAKSAPTAPTTIEPPQSGERRVEVKMKASPSVMIAYHKPQYPNPEDPAIGMMSEILGGSTVSPLYQELVEKRKILSGVSEQEVPGQMYPNLLLFSLDPKAPYTNQDAAAAFDEVVGKFKASGPTDEELQAAKRTITVSLLGSFKSNQGLALNLGGNELLYGRWDASLDWLNQALEVTKEDVVNAAKKYLVKENRVVGFVEGAK